MDDIMIHGRYPSQPAIRLHSHLLLAEQPRMDEEYKWKEWMRREGKAK